MADNTRAAWRFLRSKGLSPAQAAGVIGSMQGESGPGLDPAAVNPGPDHATGIAQWLGGRKTAAVMSKQLGPQLNHLWHELQTSERGALGALKGAHTPEQAAIAWQREFERGAPFEQKYNLRASNARNVFNRLSGVPGDASAAGGGTTTTQIPGQTIKTTIPTVDQSGFQAAQQKALVGQLIARRNPNSFLLRSGLLSTASPSLSDFTGSQTITDKIPGRTVTNAALVPSAGTQVSGQGASAALGWAKSKIGQHESGGPNQGGLAGYLNQRFGMSGQPWCAMFTSAAVTKGGAPPSARTASVAQVRQKAQMGQGYVRGYINPAAAKAGDLVLFGNRHIGMVQSVRGGQIRYVGGNQSDGVSEGVTGLHGVSVVRPRYGARHR